VRRLRAPLREQVADFIGYLETKHGLSDEPVTAAKTAQEKVWSPSGITTRTQSGTTGEPGTLVGIPFIDTHLSTSAHNGAVLTGIVP
jgi:hypothetical protein